MTIKCNLRHARKPYSTQLCRCRNCRKITNNTRAIWYGALISGSVLLSACNSSVPEPTLAAKPDTTIEHDSPVAYDLLLADQPHTESTTSETTSAMGTSAPAPQTLHSKSLVNRTNFTHVSEALHYPLLPNFSDNEIYADVEQNSTVITREQSVSTFSIDVDTGAYSNVRRFLANGQLPPSNAVRVEELINYFDYGYASQKNPGQPFSVTTETGPNPWNSGTRLLHVGLQGYTPANIDDQSANLVFLIDVSGSMNNPDKLGLLKSAIGMMVGQLDKNDTVSMVVYAGSSGIVLEPTPGNEHATIRRALSKLSAGGSTNGAQGIELAYQLAMDNFIKNGTNRVILATDGDFNVGTSDIESLVEVINNKRVGGIALTTLGFGMGNYNDHLMEQLADAGDGNYAYIDTLGEARKVLVEELAATLTTIANDVKIQIEFNPATVSEYRLIGYTNRQLNNEDFKDDRVDAGEIGAGHSVTALYEIALIDEGGERHTPSRYNSQSNETTQNFKNELAELRLRYKLPGNEKSDVFTQIIELPGTQQNINNNSTSFRFAASVAAFGQLLSGDTRVNNFGYAEAHALASTALEADTYGYRTEYLRLLDLAQSLDDIKRASVTNDDSNG